MMKNIEAIKIEYLAEIAEIKEPQKTRNMELDALILAQEFKLKNMKVTPLTQAHITAAKPEGWTGEKRNGFGWAEYEYRYADGSTAYIQKMAKCKGWKCGKEFLHNYDCCKECYEKSCTKCGEKFGNPYKPMCKKCYGETNAKFGKWKKVKKQGYAFK